MDIYICNVSVLTVFWITPSQVLLPVLKSKKVVRKYLGTYTSNTKKPSLKYNASSLLPDKEIGRNSVTNHLIQ